MKTFNNNSENCNINLWYSYITEKIYEKFPLESIEVLPIGADINKIKSLFHYKILESQLEFCKENKQVTDSILKCMELFELPFDQIDKSEAWLVAELAWSAAELTESEAWSAAELTESETRSAAASADSAVKYAAESAARYAAEYAAELAASVTWSAAESVETVAKLVERSTYPVVELVWSAARSVSRSAVWSTSEQDYYVFMKDTLLTCIKETY